MDRIPSIAYENRINMKLKTTRIENTEISLFYELAKKNELVDLYSKKPGKFYEGRYMSRDCMIKPEFSMNQFELARGLSHHGILTLLSFNQKDKCVITEKLPDFGTLRTYTYAKRDQLLSPEGEMSLKLMSFIRFILKTLEYIHSKHVAHEDLNANNVLVWENKYGDLRCKVFGMSGDLGGSVDSVRRIEAKKKDFCSVAEIIEKIYGDRIQPVMVKKFCNYLKQTDQSFFSVLNHPILVPKSKTDKRHYLERVVDSGLRDPVNRLGFTWPKDNETIRRRGHSERHTGNAYDEDSWGLIRLTRNSIKHFYEMCSQTRSNLVREPFSFLEHIEKTYPHMICDLHSVVGYLP